MGDDEAEQDQRHGDDVEAEEALSVASPTT
jgi:hypothetical protein